MGDITRKPVKKAIITAAGRGTRFLPITKSIPKELLPVGNLPTIHYLVEECKLSGIEEVCIVVREWGSLTEDYFERDTDLERFLISKGKEDMVDLVKDTSLGMKISFVKQDPSYPVGHGSPILSARDFIGDDPFAMMFGDDIIRGEQPGIKTMIDAWEQNPDLGGMVISDDVPEDQIHFFSTIKFKEGEDRGEVRLLDTFFEKPKTKEQIFAYEAFVGRAMYESSIIDILERNLNNRRASDGEFSLWDAMVDLAHEKGVGVLKVKGKWLTTGNADQMWETQKYIRENK